MLLPVRICSILILAQPVVGLMCYFCADTSGQEGKNQCQTWHRTMKYYSKKARLTGSYKTEKYVKNCTDYGSGTRQTYCMVASVEQGNDVKSFIRDCAEDTNFFSEDIDQHFDANIVLPDNQTSCKYTGQGYTVCVTICGGEYGFGDFCNGPLSSVATLHASLVLTLTTVLCAFYNLKGF